MAVFVVGGGPAGVAGGGGLSFDGAEVCAEEFVLGDAEEVVFEGGAEGVGEGFFGGVGERDGFDAVLAEGAGGGFSELEAEAGLVDGGAAEVGEGEEVVEDFFLDMEGGVLEADELAGEEGGVDVFEEAEDGEVVEAADVEAEEEVVGGAGGLGEGEFPGGVFWVFGGFDEGGVEEEGVVVGGLAHVFLEEGFVVGGGVADEVEVGGVVHELPWVIWGEFLFEFEEEALVEGVLEGYAVEGDGFGVVVEGDFLDEVVEEVVVAAVGGDDFELAAPGDAGVGDGVEELGVGVEGEFVEDAGAAFAGLGVWVGGEGVDVGVVVEMEGEGGGAGVVGEDIGVDGGGGDIEGFGEGFAVFDEEASLGFVAGGDPGVEAVDVEGLAADEGVCGGPGHADLA